MSLLPEWFEFQVPGKIVFGANSVEGIGREMDMAGGSKVLLVTDPGVEKAGLAKKVILGMESGNSRVAGIFTEVPPESEVRAVQECYEAAVEAGADSLISIGGGSVIDTAKATAILMLEGGDLLDHQCSNYLPSDNLFPHIAVPTTAGTGAESTSIAVIKDAAQQLKITYKGARLAPRMALLDPVLTGSLPPDLTASTGFGALAHCVESIHSLGCEPLSDGLALHGIKLIAGNLEKALYNPDDMEARGNMLIAANLGGISSTNAYSGIVNAVAHAVNGRFGVPHGVANAVVLPAGMALNLKFEGVQERYLMIAEALGVVINESDEEAAIGKAIEFILDLRERAGLPTRLRDVGVEKSGIEGIARDALADGSMIFNPAIPELEDIVGLVEKVY